MLHYIWFKSTNFGYVYSNISFDKVSLPEDEKTTINNDDFKINKKALSEDIKMMHEFIEFKYFKKVMKRNKNIFE